MNKIKLLALALIVCGVLGLLYGSFTYTQETHTADLGALQVSIDENKTVNVPAWLGAILIASGTILLFTGKSKS